MIRSAADQGIMSERNAMNRGAWVGMSKIGSLGIAVRHSVSFHGFALNVNTPMEPFRWIHPCGLNPDCAVDIYCGLKTLAATLVSRFCFLTYLLLCLRHKIAPTSRLANVFCASLRHLLHNLGLIIHDWSQCILCFSEHVEDTMIEKE